MHPVGGVDYPETFQDLLAWFRDDNACLAYLARLRWPDGFVCPVCGSGHSWQTAKARRMCAERGRQTSVTAGTIFHRTRTPLSTWFAAVWFVTSQKNGVSAQGLQRVLGFGSYDTAWAWLHKLRRTMVRPDRDLLSGTVELGEVFIGNETRGRADGARDNTAAMVAIESLPGRK
ncbi:MAG: IS1595 family transposase, partial [Nakamurella sp.]